MMNTVWRPRQALVKEALELHASTGYSAQDGDENYGRYVSISRVTQTARNTSQVWNIRARILYAVWRLRIPSHMSYIPAFFNCGGFLYSGSGMSRTHRQNPNNPVYNEYFPLSLFTTDAAFIHHVQ